jgi:hypothetical protein
MAPLTWRNVNAPDFASSARILGNAGRGLSSGVGNISGAFKDARARQINTRSNEGIGQLAGATTESDVERIMAEVLGSVSARDRNGALNTAIMGSNGRALGLDGDRADIRNTENMISSRNAASGRAASAAQAALDRQASIDAANLIHAENNAAVAPEVLPVTAGSIMPAPVAPITDTAPVISRDKVLRDGKRTAGDDKVEGGSGEDTLSADGFRTEHEAAMDRIVAGDVRPGDAELFRQGANPTFDPTIRSLEGNRAAFDDTANRPDSPEQERAQVQDRAFANASQPSVGAGSNSAERNFAPNGGIAGAVQNGSVTPSGNQVTDMTTLTSPAQQAQIDQVMEENTDPTTGEPVSPEAADNVFRTVADIIKETNAPLSYERINDMIAVNQARLNRDRDTRQTEYTANVEEQLRGELQKRGANGVEELTQIIRNNPDLSPRDREAYQSALKRFVDPEGNNAGYFTSTGGENLGTETDVGTFEENLAQVRDRTDLASFLNLDEQALNDTEEGSASSGLTRTVEALVSSAGGDLDYENVLSTVQSFQSESGLPYRIIQAQLENSLTGNWINTKAVLNDDILRRNLSPYLNAETGKADPAAIERVQSAARAQRSIRTDMDLLNTEVTSLNNEYRVLLDRPEGPEVTAQIEKLRARHTEIMAEGAKLNGNAGSLLTPPTVPPVLDENGNPVEATAPDPAPEPVTGGADDRFNIPINTPTPRGSFIDPRGSLVDRAFNTSAINAEVGQAVLNIRGELQRNGGSNAAAFIGNVRDAFRPQAESDANTARRDQSSEALDWFRTDEAMQVLYSDPSLIEEAREDPVAFYQKMTSNR